MALFGLYFLPLIAGLQVSSRGGKYGYVEPGQHDVYRALRRKGFSKTSAARIANAQNGLKAKTRGLKTRTKTNRTGR